jgi:hypothetical protein
MSALATLAEPIEPEDRIVIVEGRYLYAGSRLRLGESVTQPWSRFPGPNLAQRLAMRAGSDAEVVDVLYPLPRRPGDPEGQRRYLVSRGRHWTRALAHGVGTALWWAPLYRMRAGDWT